MAVRDVIQAAAGALGGDKLYVEDVFSTYLYTGNGSTQTITNGIDLAGEGGLVWIKDRTNANNNVLTNTDSGLTKFLYSNSTSAELTSSNGIQSVSSDGFVIGPAGAVNGSGAAIASWTFRKAPKFFDVVTYTGDGVDGRAIPHNLGSVPGCVIVKVTSTTGYWPVYHRGVNGGVSPEQYAMYLDLTNSQGATRWANTAPTDTNFYVSAHATTNNTGQTYVAYLFAHDAGGFGDDGEQNVVSCGSYTGTGANGNAVTLGYEPQWIIVKNTTAGSGDSWWMMDSMRGFPVRPTNSTTLRANVADAELGPAAMGANILSPTATGFEANGSSSATNGSGQTYIYIAIRRGPMKTPTSGTEVFSPAIGNNSTSAGGEIFTTNFPVDFFMRKVRATTDFAPFAYSRLTAGKYLVTGTTAAEATDTSTWFDTNTGIDYQYASNLSGQIGWLFQRAPGFFDVVCYTGTGSGIARNHNLAALPELVITKARTNVGGQMNWYVGHYGLNQYATSISTAAVNNTNLSTYAPVTTTTFVPLLNTNTGTFVTYLFASCPGVSKVGSYTGTGTTQQINCGFTTGARFVLIKRTDSTGDWYVWDSARGIVSGNDPYLLLNSTAAEVTSTDYIDPYSAGFEISSTAPAAINASGGSYIYLAIA